MPSFSQQLSRLAALFAGNQNSYGLPLSNRNYFVDGNMDSVIAQSAAVAAGGSSSGVATMYYGIGGATNGGTLAVNAAPWALGTEPAGMTSPVANVLTWTQAAAPTSAPSISQRIENVQTLQGRAATFSCWLWCASGTQTITNIVVLQNFGSGGSPSAAVVTNVPVNWVLTTTPQRFSVLLNIPTVAGKTLGTTVNTHYLQVYLQYPASGTYAINTAQWQLEQSSPNAPPAGMPTTFEYRGQQAELARVQRHYEIGTIYALGTSAGAGAAPFGPVAFKVTKRSGPAVAFARQSQAGVASAAATTLAFGSSTIDQFTPNATMTGSGGYNWVDNWTADARL